MQIQHRIVCVVLSCSRFFLKVFIRNAHTAAGSSLQDGEGARYQSHYTTHSGEITHPPFRSFKQRMFSLKGTPSIQQMGQGSLQHSMCLHTAFFNEIGMVGLQGMDVVKTSIHSKTHREYPLLYISSHTAPCVK